MSAETATQFLDQLVRDPAMRMQLQTSGVMNAKSVMDLALAKDYVFTDDDLKTALAAYPDNPTINQIRQQLHVKPARTA